MKDKLLTIITVIAIGVLLVLLQSCHHNDEEVTPETVTDTFEQKLFATWKIVRVTVDNIDVTNAFKDMGITFRADHSYSVEHDVAPIWPASGSFAVDEQHDMKRNDGTTIDVTSLTDTQVIFELFYTSSTGRVSGVSGHYKFEMVH